MVVSIATGLVSVTSRASMTVLVIGGVVRASLLISLLVIDCSIKLNFCHYYENLLFLNFKFQVLYCHREAR